MNDKAKRVALLVGVASAAALITLAVLRLPAGNGHHQMSFHPLVMGTQGRLVAVGPAEQLQGAIDAAMAEIRAVEATMSRHNPATPLSKFNHSPAGTDFELDGPTLDVMRFGQVMWARTGGAFDVTMLPLGRLWSRAAGEDRLPTEAELAEVRQHVGQDKLVLGPGSARKVAPGLQVSLDAIAKGYAADRAAEAMQRAGAVAGLVDIGGDVRTFGTMPPGWAVRVHVRNPFDAGTVLTVGPAAGAELAICTSGNYERFVEIDGRRYSHIIDPRTGQPADTIPSVTVIAPDAMTADGWATALSVLDIESGRELVEAEAGVEALWITGDKNRPILHFSSGFEGYVIGR